MILEFTLFITRNIPNLLQEFVNKELLEFYCNISKDRPKCGSVGMNERFNFKRKDVDEYDEWLEWSKKNKVSPCGMCNKFEKDGLTMQSL
jgi:hypothetical protein